MEMGHLLTELPADIRQAGYVKGGEAAWAARDAIVMLDWLDRRDLAVPEIEVWLPTEPGPTIPSPYIYRWEADAREPGEAWAAFRRRVNDDARRYIGDFRWHEADILHRGAVPFFNLAVEAENA